MRCCVFRLIDTLWAAPCIVAPDLMDSLYTDKFLKEFEGLDRVTTKEVRQTMSSSEEQSEELNNNVVKSVCSSFHCHHHYNCKLHRRFAPSSSLA